MRLWTTLAVLFTFGTFVLAADEKDNEKSKKPSGAYTKKAGDFDVTFDFHKKDKKVTFKMTNGSDGCTMESNYTLEKDGVIKCKVTKFEKMGNFPVDKEVGYEFSFKYELNKKKLTISNLDGKDIDEAGRQTVEGEYEAAKD